MAKKEKTSSEKTVTYQKKDFNKALVLARHLKKHPADKIAHGRAAKLADAVRVNTAIETMPKLADSFAVSRKKLGLAFLSMSPHAIDRRSKTRGKYSCKN